MSCVQMTRDTAAVGLAIQIQFSQFNQSTYFQAVFALDGQRI